MGLLSSTIEIESFLLDFLIRDRNNFLITVPVFVACVIVLNIFEGRHKFGAIMKKPPRSTGRTVIKILLNYYTVVVANNTTPMSILTPVHELPATMQGL